MTGFTGFDCATNTSGRWHIRNRNEKGGFDRGGITILIFVFKTRSNLFFTNGMGVKHENEVIDRDCLCDFVGCSFRATGNGK